MDLSPPHPDNREIIVNGQYERIPTDTVYLASELSRNQDLSKLVLDFDAGYTPVRDVGGMYTAQRSAILNAYQNNTLYDLLLSHSILLARPIANLHSRVVDGPRDQPVGHNFFVNATGFFNAGFNWAVDFDRVMRERYGKPISDIAQSEDINAKDQILAEITDAPDAYVTTTLAAYLAGRSLAGEEYLHKNYGEILEYTKSQTFETTKKIALSVGLDVNMLERAALQLQRATFGSFDHLSGLVTSDERRALGDYYIGSLRVEVLYDGNIRSGQIRSASDANHILAHELHHVSSAQSEMRCGLYVDGHGLEADEGMTEYLAQVTLGYPGIESLSNGSKRVNGNVPYRVAVLSMLALHEQFKAGSNIAFAVLFKAYHGDVRNRQQLEDALEYFYAQDAAISRVLNN